jgi:hypothetical protein
MQLLWREPDHGSASTITAVPNETRVAAVNPVASMCRSVDVAVLSPPLVVTLPTLEPDHAVRLRHDLAL